MAQVIQCPTCAKKFKLPDRPPATFTCTGCQTVMDLSAFRTAAAAAPAPAPEPAAAASAPASAAAGARAGASSSRSARPEGGSGASTRTSSAARRSRPRDDDDDRDALPPPKDNTKVMVLGAIAGIVVIGLIAVLVLNRKKPPAPQPDAPATAGATGTTVPLPPPTAGMATASTSPAPKGTAPTAGGSEAPPAMDGEKPVQPAGVTSSKNTAIKEVGHHPDATEDEKKNIDHLIDVAIFQNAGRDSKEAEQQLVAIGIKAAPRLINVFNTVKLQEGYENRLGKMKVGIADRALRAIDGYVDRAAKGRRTLVTAASDPKFVEGVAKTWNNWWDMGYYKEPKKPWDERTEGNRGEKADPTDKDNPGTTDGK